MQQRDRLPTIALACGASATIAAVLVYWMVIISVGLGIAAIVLSVRVRRRDAGGAKGRELAAAAIALGLVGILGTGAFLTLDWTEDHGRDCTLGKCPGLR